LVCTVVALVVAGDIGRGEHVRPPAGGARQVAGVVGGRGTQGAIATRVSEPYAVDEFVIAIDKVVVGVVVTVIKVALVAAVTVKVGVSALTITIALPALLTVVLIQPLGLHIGFDFVTQGLAVVVTHGLLLWS
jgi:hypothetical protein